MIVLIIPATEIWKRRNRRPRTAAGAPAPNNPRDEYNRKLRRYMDRYLAPTTAEVLQRYADGATIDEIAAILDHLQVNTSDKLAEVALRDLQVWFSDIDGYSKKRFEDSIRRAMGVDAKSILNPVLADKMRKSAISENVALIRGLTREHYKDVMGAILTDYRGDGFTDGSKSLAGRIQAVTGMTKDRASFIARDQTAKLNSILAEAHQTEAGITHYVWRTAGDRRVVGTPGGLYPKWNEAHGNHYARDGKIYSWKNPPADGPPGQAIGCRCIAAPVINPAEIKAMDLRTEPEKYRKAG
ncbi:MAG: hypothetical protein FWG74_09280 [Planctomycetes bacterium]|nr:hypothetical protein [Planctomycetota bacterium]